MVEKASFKTVEVLVNGKTEEIKMEQGTSFENKSSIYKVDEDLNLKRYDKTTNVWETASSIEMRNYQWKAFQNVANNDGDVTTYTKADVEKAMELYRNGEFKADMSEDLPSGYRIEKPAKYTNDKMVQVDVTNGNESQSATLKFKIENVDLAKFVEEVEEVQEEQDVQTVADVKQQEALIGADAELVKKYAEEFKNMTSDEIAEALKEQIYGLSNSKETLSMYDAIPEDKLKEVMDLYQKKTHKSEKIVRYREYRGYEITQSYIWHEEEALYRSMSKEFGISDEEIVSRMFKYLDTYANKLNDKQYEVVYNAIKKLDKINDEQIGNVIGIMKKTGLLSDRPEGYSTD